MRLNKYISNSGVCSRRKADELILAGHISVNGHVVRELGTQVQAADEVMYDEKCLSIKKLVYLLLNKPKGYITSAHDPHHEKTVFDLLKGACKERIYPVGRLDKESMGLLLFTNDGELTQKLSHPSNQKKKIYFIELDKNLATEDLERIRKGVRLEDGIAEIDAIEVHPGHVRNAVGVEMHSGKNRILRRLFSALGYHIKKLDRVYFAGLTKKNLPRGKWRFLSPQEIARLKMGHYD